MSTNEESEWINVLEKLPKESGIYRCKGRVGSMSPKPFEREARFKRINEEFGRFCECDWETITHWKELK